MPSTVRSIFRKSYDGFSGPLIKHVARINLDKDLFNPLEQSTQVNPIMIAEISIEIKR